MTYGDKAFKTKTAQNAGGNATFEEIAEFERDPKINTLKVRGTSPVRDTQAFEMPA